MQANHQANESDAEVEGVTADSYGTLDVSAADEACWMIRVPPKLYELWNSAEEGTQLGELIFTKGGATANGKTMKPSLEVSVSEILAKKDTSGAVGHPSKRPSPKPTAAPIIPLNYSLQAMTKKIPPLHPFVRHPTNGSCQLIGTVTRTANLQVERSAAYSAQLQQRLVEHNVQKKTFVKPTATTDSIVHKQRSKGQTTSSNNKRSFGNAVLQFGKRNLEAAQERSAVAQQGSMGDNKKSRKFTPDQPLKSVIFELFAQEPFWTIKDLKAAAAAGGCAAAVPKKAEAEMREILKNEIGYYHRSGDHKQKWELRKEFQQSVAASAQMNT